HRAAASGRSIRHKPSERSRLLRAICTACFDLASDELAPRNLHHVVEILNDVLQFAAKRHSTLGQVRTRLEEILIRDDLARGGEQQRRDRLPSLTPALSA